MDDKQPPWADLSNPFEESSSSASSLDSPIGQDPPNEDFIRRALQTFHAFDDNDDDGHQRDTSSEDAVVEVAIPAKSGASTTTTSTTTRTTAPIPGKGDASPFKAERNPKKKAGGKKGFLDRFKPSKPKSSMPVFTQEDNQAQIAMLPLTQMLSTLNTYARLWPAYFKSSPQLEQSLLDKLEQLKAANECNREPYIAVCDSFLLAAEAVNLPVPEAASQQVFLSLGKQSASIKPLIAQAKARLLFVPYEHLTRIAEVFRDDFRALVFKRMGSLVWEAVEQDCMDIARKLMQSNVQCKPSDVNQGIYRTLQNLPDLPVLATWFRCLQHPLVIEIARVIEDKTASAAIKKLYFVRTPERLALTQSRSSKSKGSKVQGRPKQPGDIASAQTIAKSTLLANEAVQSRLKEAFRAIDLVFETFDFPQPLLELMACMFDELERAYGDSVRDGRLEASQADAWIIELKRQLVGAIFLNNHGLASRKLVMDVEPHLSTYVLTYVQKALNFAQKEQLSPSLMSKLEPLLAEALTASQITFRDYVGRQVGAVEALRSKRSSTGMTHTVSTTTSTTTTTSTSSSRTLPTPPSRPA